MASIYKKLKKFMQDYCKDYSRYANDEETIDKMDDYWAADLNVVAYFHREDGTYPVIYPSRQAFKDFLVTTHRLVKDSLNPIDIIVDERAKKVVILEKILKTDVKTGENISIDGMGSYSLSVEDGGKFKIKRLDFFWDAPEEIKNLGK